MQGGATLHAGRLVLLTAALREPLTTSGGLGTGAAERKLTSLGSFLGLLGVLLRL